MAETAAITDTARILGSAEALLSRRDFAAAVSMLASLDSNRYSQPADGATLLKHCFLLHYISEKAPQFLADVTALFARLAAPLRTIPDDAFATKESVYFAMWGAMCANDHALAERLLHLLSPMQKLSPIIVSPTMSLKQWGDRHRIPCVELEAQSDISIPHTSADLPAIRYQRQPIWVARVPNARCYIDWDIVLAEDGTVLADTGQMHVKKAYPSVTNLYSANFNRIVHYWPPQTIDVDEDAVLLPRGYLGNFGHWLIGVLPRLRTVKLFEKLNVKLAVPEHLSRKETEMLQCFGFGAEHMIHCRSGFAYRFRSLIAGTFDTGMPPHRGSVEFVRSNLYQPLPPKPVGQRAKRVFLARGEVLHRNIINMPELDSVLIDEGFRIIDMSKLSWGEQVDVLAETEIMMGMYGSNMFAVYSAPTTCHIEVLFPDRIAPDPVIRHTAHFLGFSYGHFVGCKCVGDDDTGSAYQVRVDCVALRRRIRALSKGSTGLS